MGKMQQHRENETAVRTAQTRRSKLRVGREY